MTVLPVAAAAAYTDDHAATRHHDDHMFNLLLAHESRRFTTAYADSYVFRRHAHIHGVTNVRAAHEQQQQSYALHILITDRLRESVPRVVAPEGLICPTSSDSTKETYVCGQLVWLTGQTQHMCALKQ